MNEHIEKFARECGAWNQVYGNRSFMIDEHFDIEKFARLIVQECTEVTADWYKNHNQYHMPPDEHIKAHFGLQY
jgi:hypothetical protein